jgi:hypothetical protein
MGYPLHELLRRAEISGLKFQKDFPKFEGQEPLGIFVKRFQ